MNREEAGVGGRYRSRARRGVKPARKEDTCRNLRLGGSRWGDAHARAAGARQLPASPVHTDVPIDPNQNDPALRCLDSTAACGLGSSFAQVRDELICFGFDFEDEMVRLSRFGHLWV
jgi:hypothetical protein